MKINTIAFGCLISRISVISGNEMYHGTVRDIHDLVQECLVEPEVPAAFTVACSQVDALMFAFQKGQKIEAIKSYCVLTNSGLREAKEAVNRYWLNVEANKPQY